MGDVRGRREASERRLREHGVEPDPALRDDLVPGDVSLRDPVEIAERAIVLCLSAARAEGLDAATAGGLAAQLGVEDALTPSEMMILFSPHKLAPDVKQRYQWRYESCLALLWMLGRVPELEFPDHGGDGELASRLVTSSSSADELAGRGQPRALDDVAGEADFTLRLAAAVRRAIGTTAKPPDEVEFAIVHQREHAFRWALVADADGWGTDRVDP